MRTALRYTALYKNQRAATKASAKDGERTGRSVRTKGQADRQEETVCYSNGRMFYRCTNARRQQELLRMENGEMEDGKRKAGDRYFNRLWRDYNVDRRPLIEARTSGGHHTRSIFAP